MALLRRYWGFLALGLAILGWVTGTIVPAVILTASVLALGYFLFQAPLWCGAVTRDNRLCRNNCSGLLIGCHLREHKWQKLKMLIIPKLWRDLNRGLWTSPRESVTTLGGLGSLISALAAVIAVLVTLK